MLTFAVERYGEEIALFTEDVRTGETVRIGTLVSEAAVLRPRGPERAQLQLALHILRSEDDCG